MVAGEFYNEKIDIWALGMIMIKLITGKNAINQQYKKDAIEDIINFKIDYEANECWQKYSKVCKNLISKLLQATHEKRLSSEEALNHLFFESKIDEMLKKT